MSSNDDWYRSFYVTNFLRYTENSPQPTGRILFVESYIKNLVGAIFYNHTDVEKLFVLSLEQMQSKAEEIYIEEPISDNEEFNADEILKNIITNIKDNQ